MAFLTASSLSEAGKIFPGVKRKPRYVALLKTKLHLVYLIVSLLFINGQKEIAKSHCEKRDQSYEPKNHQCNL
jgi:hypothetical protein